MQNQRHEFDDYINKYRENQNKDVALSGETGEFFAEYKIQKMLSWFPELKDSSKMVLDFGCGDGLMTHYARKLFPESTIFGTDPSAKSIEYAEHLYSNEKISFSTMKGDRLDYHDATFDYIFAAGVFHHIPFAEHEHFVKELVRISKKNGRIIIFELNPLNPLTVLTFKKSPIDKNATMLYPGYTKKLLAPFGELSHFYYCFFPSFVKKLRPLEPLMTWLPLGALYATIIKVK